MSTPAPQFIDAANPLLAQVPTRMDSGTIDIPGSGKVAIVTIRTASTTLSVIMSAEELRTWSDILSRLAASMPGGSGIVVPSAAETVALARGNGRP